MSKMAPRLADHRTPFIRNEWYVAALSTDVGRTMMRRRILGVDILFYRKLDGAAVALRNRCPHRSFPLSEGTLDGDIVTCGYHGLRFAPDGICVEVPSQDSVPAAVAAKPFRVVERAPFLWIWMGDPDLAEEAAIPDHHWLSSPDYAAYSGYLFCRSNYVRLHENVLDLTHFPYVHGEATGGMDYIRAPAEVQTHGDRVSITRTLRDRPVNLAYGTTIGNVGHRVNRTSESWFETPGFHIAHARIEDLEGGVDGRTSFNFKIIHCFTPETPHTTHYFYANARDVRIDDEALTRAGAERTRLTFLEDDAALELVERLWIEDDNSDFEEVSVRGDRAGLQMRYAVAQRALREMHRA